MIRLLNSAMMPRPGRYIMQEITREEFFSLISKAQHEGKLVSYIGYPQNAAYIKRHTGISVSLSRQETEVEDGDTLLIMRLRYRLQDDTKGAKRPEDEFQFFEAQFQEL